MMQSVWPQTPASMLTPPPYAQPMTTYASPWMMCGLYLCQFRSGPLHQQSHILCAFKFGNIFVCNGCRNKFSDNLVIQHKEFRNFTSPHTGLRSSKFGNTYYHLQKRCIELKIGTAINRLATVPRCITFFYHAMVTTFRHTSVLCYCKDCER